ncbi:hypothetical protein BDN72DRAFT_904719 [Pluteus cervinus]|uniref:Uncharacterized protein n=1 Tax=Pluteus cervinus TaxID=181527 RepID=A0ACD3A4X3_9AGAR|nr:hypothetical protein BDN72DRAFT_904719 [Pluteus cervinus]
MSRPTASKQSHNAFGPRVARDESLPPSDDLEDFAYPSSQSLPSVGDIFAVPLVPTQPVSPPPVTRGTRRTANLVEAVEGWRETSVLSSTLLKKEWSPLLPPSQPTTKSHLVTNRLLSRLGIRVHDVYKVAICVECQFAQPASGFYEHLERHGLDLHHNDEDLLKSTFTKLGVPSDVFSPHVPSPPPTAVELLKVFRHGRRCLNCQQCFADHASFLQHLADEHGEGKAPGRSRQCAVQTFFYPVGADFFEVKGDISTLEASYDFFLNEYRPRSSIPTIPDNIQEIPPLILNLQWEHRLDPYFGTGSEHRRHALNQQVTVPRSDFRLTSAVKAYMVHVATIAGQLPYVTRCFLQDCLEPDPMRPPQPPPFTHDALSQCWTPLSDEGEFNRYAAVAASLLFTVASGEETSPSGYSIPLPGNLLYAVREFNSIWRDTDETIRKELVHSVFVAILLLIGLLLTSFALVLRSALE